MSKAHPSGISPSGINSSSLTPAEYHYNPIGTVHGGVLATPLDPIMGCALHATLPQGRGYRTLESR